MTTGWLVSQPLSWITSLLPSYKHGDDVEVGPFSGRLMLPTKLQVLKLHLFLRDEAGKKNQNFRSAKSMPKYYWNLAGFEKRNMSNKKSLEDRKKFEEDLNKLLDIAHPDLEKNLAQDWIRGNLENLRTGHSSQPTLELMLPSPTSFSTRSWKSSVKLTRCWQMTLSLLSPATSGSWLPHSLSSSPSSVRSWRMMTSQG